MKYLRLFEDFEPHDPYELMIIPPNKKTEMIISEMKKGKPNLNLVQDLITLGANLDWEPEEKDIYKGDYSLLDIAMHGNHKEIFKMLVDGGADINAKNPWGERPLHRAISSDSSTFVNMLIEGKANINAKDNDGFTPLSVAVKNNNSPFILKLIEAGADINAMSKRGKTPLHVAAIWDFSGPLKILVEAGAKLDIQDLGGWAALHEAVVSNSPSCVRILLKAGARKDIADKEGRLPYDLAKTEEMRELLNPNLSESFESYDPYELMITPPNMKAEMIIREIGKDEPNLNLISDLIVLGANLDWKDDYGYTPLIQAARFGEVGIIRMLIDKKVDLDAQNDNGWTALHMIASVHWGKEEAAKMLIAAGARKDIEDKWGRLPYDLAKTEELRELLNPNLSESFEEYDPHELMIMFPNQKTELIIQEIKSDEPNLNLVSDLIVLGANPDGKDEYGSTLLQWTAFHNNKEIAQMLIGAGADKDLQDDNGWTALHVAASENNPEIAKLLLDAGARKDIENEDGRTPLDTAIENASFDTIQLLQNLE